MKKTFYIFFLSFFFSFFAILTYASNIKALGCVINQVEYELPKTIGIVNSYSYTIFDEFPTENRLPDSYTDNITLISIENESSCLSIKNYPYKYAIAYNSKMGKTTYTYTNILVDTNTNNTWSYSSTLPIFSTTTKTYEVSYSGVEPATFTAHFYANVGYLTTLEELQTYILATEDVQGLNLVNVEPTSNAYTPSYNILGDYLVSFQATDSDSNIAILNLWVHVVDITSPVITGPTSLESKMSSPLTIEEITSFLTISDNYDKNTTISLLHDNFSSNEQKIGCFIVEFQATDSSGNNTIHLIEITTIDDVLPTITGITHIIKGSSSNMDVNYVKSLLSATDNITGNINSLIELLEDSYSNSYNIVGNYHLSFIVQDNNGNTSLPYNIIIDVYDSVPPIFHVDENVIITDSSRIVTKEEIFQLFVKTGQLEDTDIANLSIVNDNYSANYAKAGKYNITYALNQDDAIKVLSVDLKVRTDKQNKQSPNIIIFLGSAALLSSIFIIKRLIRITIKV